MSNRHKNPDYVSVAMRAPFFLLTLLVIPVTQAYVLVYTKGFDYRQNYGKDTYVIPESVEQIVSTWREWGYGNLQASEKLDPQAEGIIVMGCTELSEEDVRMLGEYVEKGGRLVIDLYCPGNVDNFMYRYGVMSSEMAYSGGILQKMVLPYAEIRGYPVDKPIIRPNTPLNSKYAMMVYSGPTFTITGKSFSHAFLTPNGQLVAFTAEIGKGGVYASGCLLCSNQLLMANILDWVSDGRVDFPRFEVSRRVYPRTKEVGRPFYDEIRISRPSEERESVEISVAYLYNKEGFCKLVPTQDEGGDEDAVVFRFEYVPQERMSCSLAPVIVSMTWISPEGKIVREFTVPGENVQVIAPSIYVPPSAFPYVAVAVMIVLAGLAVVGARYYKRKRLRDLKLQLKALEESLNDLHKKLMTRQITEDVYKRLVERYVAKIEELKAEIRVMERKEKR